MRTLREAALRLETLHTPQGRLSLASSLGFDPIALPVDDAFRQRLGLPAHIDAAICRGAGALRALLVSAPPGASLAVVFAQLASALTSRTSHVLWLVIGATATGDDVGMACWSSLHRAARPVALIATRARITSSDAEAVCAMVATCVGDDLIVHTRWCELLGRDALTRRFYRTLEQRVCALADSAMGLVIADRHELALLYVSRLLFLSFLEAKGWLNDDRAFLVHRFDECMASGGRFHQRVLLPLFFGTLNTPMSRRAATARRFGNVPFLNGGLFGKNPFERRNAHARFSDAAIGALFGELLGAYRFTAREGDDNWSDAAIDPEMLGRAFESLMASRERRVSGAFYTPHALVSHVTERALSASLCGGAVERAVVAAAMRGDLLADAQKTLLRARLRAFTVLDPACGSGAFLVHVLDRLTQLHVAAGDCRAVAVIRREVLARSIHGVDINPTAVWLCELRLWLAVVIESAETRMSAVPPLPNLDCNVRVGDALSGDAFSQAASLVGPSAALARLRDRYVRAAGPAKAPLRRALQREERLRVLSTLDRELSQLTVLRKERLALQKAADFFGERSKPDSATRDAMRTLRLRVASLRRERRRIVDHGALPFSFPSHFGVVHARGGFDLVIGNPPWIRVHNIPASARSALRARYAVYRDAAWAPAADGPRASAGFAAQIDLAALFVERSLGLVSRAGVIALLLPVKLWRSLSGGGVRRLLRSQTRLQLVEDWSEGSSAFAAAVYPSVLIASRGSVGNEEVDVAVRRVALEVTWSGPNNSLGLVAGDDASPWLLIPPSVRAAFDLVSANGTALGNSSLGRVMLGVKCGCNDAFTVSAIGEQADVVIVEHSGRRGKIETDMLRPLLRGDSVLPWRIATSRDAIVWTHRRPSGVLAVLPAGAARWLTPWRRQLSNRTDLRGSAPWWTLFRTEGADDTRSRVVWSDFGRTPRAAFLPAGDPIVPLNTCYVVCFDDPRDAFAFTALLNGPIAAAWLNAVAEPARGGWHRYLAWTVSLLPLPTHWSHARDILAPVGERAFGGAPPSPAELLTASCRAYRVRAEDVAPLIAWFHQPTRA